MFSVPLKSLKRWIKVGPERKRGNLNSLNNEGTRKKNSKDNLLEEWIKNVLFKYCPVVDDRFDLLHTYKKPEIRHKKERGAWRRHALFV